jgi:hypothetical protein
VIRGNQGRIGKLEVFLMQGIVLAVGLNPSLVTNEFDWILLCHSIPAVDRERLTSLIRASGSRIPIISLARNLGECEAFANATLEDGPNKFLTGVREILVKAAKTPAV